MAKLNIFIVYGVLLVTISAVFRANAQSGSGENVENSCDADQMRCADGNGCTNLNYRCDGDKDCEDGSDDSAEICKDNCLGFEDRFQCADGTCIRSRYACNGNKECADGSDEDDNKCSSCNGNTDKFKCAGSSKCIYGNYICDSDLDCGEDDPSDEDPKICDENCGGKEDRFQCANKKCVYNSRRCNGKDDCGDGSDESAELCANCNGDTGRTKCKSSSKCFFPYDRCDGYKDCAVRDENGEIVTEDDTDEQDCPANINSSSEEEPIVNVPVEDVAPPAEE